MKYSVIFWRDNLYEVFEFNPDTDSYEDKVYQGTLADCEAWIRLKENPDVIF